MNHLLILGLAGWLSLACATSCASSSKPHACECADHPVASVAPIASASAPSPPLGSAPLASCPPPPEIPPEPPPEIPQAGASKPPVNRLSPAEVYERVTGINLSSLEKAIIDDCPTRAWDRSVPKRRCTNDGQCGDGFCDRGRCAARQSCDSDYGRPCKEGVDCGRRPCIDGRCRSCTSDRECDEKKRGRFVIGDATCHADELIPGARECMGAGMIGSMPAPAAPP